MITIVLNEDFLSVDATVNQFIVYRICWAPALCDQTVITKLHVFVDILNNNGCSVLYSAKWLQYIQHIRLKDLRSQDSH